MFAIIGPGIIGAAAGNDAGGVTTYAYAGAEYGYGLLWSVVVFTIALVVVQEMCARLGVVSGKGLADLVRESYGVKITFFILVGLLLANFATVVAEFAGIAASLEIFSIPRYVSVPTAACVVWVLITQANYRIVEKVLFVGAAIFIAYIISGLLAKPDWGEVMKNAIVPHIEFSKTYVILFTGIVGTTVAPWMQFYVQAAVVEKGVSIEDYKYTKIDIIAGSVTAGVVAFFIMVASSATLFTNGVHIETAAEAAVALEPFAGRFATILFAGGLLNASLLGAMIVPIATAYYICEGLGFESGLNKKFKEAPWFNGIFTALIFLGAIPALFPNAPLIDIMLASQVINGVLLAPVLICIMLLINKKWLMGEYVNGKLYNIFVWGVVGFLTILSVAVVVTTFI